MPHWGGRAAARPGRPRGPPAARGPPSSYAGAPLPCARAHAVGLAAAGPAEHHPVVVPAGATGPRPTAPTARRPPRRRRSRPLSSPIANYSCSRLSTLVAADTATDAPVALSSPGASRFMRQMLVRRLASACSSETSGQRVPATKHRRLGPRRARSATRRSRAVAGPVARRRARSRTGRAAALSLGPWTDHPAPGVGIRRGPGRATPRT